MKKKKTSLPELMITSTPVNYTDAQWKKMGKMNQQTANNIIELVSKIKAVTDNPKPYPDDYLDVEKLDNWCGDMLESNKRCVYIKNGKYPYNNYTQIDSLLKKYGGNMIAYLKSICPVKYVKTADISDSLAFAMQRLKIDPHSLLDMPSFKSTWDRISERFGGEAGKAGASGADSVNSVDEEPVPTRVRRRKKK